MSIQTTPLSALAPRYRAVFSDVWGVVHDGLAAIPQSCDALARIRTAGVPVLLVSNAPRPAPAVRDLLDRLGVPREAYDAILTSGDLTRDHLLARPGARVLHIGPERDLVTFEGTAARLVDRPADCDVAVCTGLAQDETETAEDYRPLLAELLALGRGMVCANPDVVVERGHKLIPCAGAVVGMYKAMGGDTLYFGKPHAPVYAEAMARLSAIVGSPLAPREVLAIGDALPTDILGANQAGLDSLFLAGGIHAKDLGAEGAIDGAALERLMAATGARPDALGWRLAW